MMASLLSGKSSKTELLKTIEEQNGKIDHYEKKLRDLVRAYKGLMKEKEVLDQSLKCLSSGSSQKPSGGQDPQGAEFTDPLNVNDPGSGSEMDVLKEQLSTLTSALSTVTQEKNKLETSYLAEKKKLKCENEELQRVLEAERAQYREEKAQMARTHEQTETLSRMLQEQVGELKAKIRSVQYEREKEHSDHGLMLRELQKLLGKERMQSEQFEQQCDELKMKLLEKERMDELRQQYEKRIHEMGSELQAVRERLKASEDKSDQPIPMLLDLQQEMGELKAQHRIQVQQEQKRANQAEERVQVMSHEAESRVAGLESKLSELSEVVGSYERLRQQDQDNIQKLKDRVTQLDMENTALARAAHSSPDPGSQADPGDEDVHALAERIVKLKSQIKLANMRADNPVDIEEILKTEEGERDEADTHRRCREELLQLKEEFERYKLRAQSVLKNKNNKDVCSGKESDSYKKQIHELKDRLNSLRRQRDEAERDHSAVVSQLRQSLTRQNEKHAQELHAAENEYRNKVSDLEQQIHKHRDRTIALLIEKDREIELFKQASPLVSQDSRTPTEEIAQLTIQIPNEEENTSLLERLGSDAQNLFLAQEQARKDVELREMRKVKRDLENQIRELRQSALTKEEELKEKISKLEEDCHRHERSKNRENANLEYLKNVVYQYMTCWDKVGKQQMLNAIATILQFSPKEKEAVVSHIGGWWGGASGGAGNKKSPGKPPNYSYSLSG